MEARDHLSAWRHHSQTVRELSNARHRHARNAKLLLLAWIVFTAWWLWLETNGQLSASIAILLFSMIFVGGALRAGLDAWFPDLTNQTTIKEEQARAEAEADWLRNHEDELAVAGFVLPSPLR